MTAYPCPAAPDDTTVIPRSAGRNLPSICGRVESAGGEERAGVLGDVARVDLVELLEPHEAVVQCVEARIVEAVRHRPPPVFVHGDPAAGGEQPVGLLDDPRVSGC